MSREAMKLALEALEVLGWQPTEEAMDYRDNAITALREALAEQPARPYRQLQDNGSKYFGESWDKAEQPAQQEPKIDIYRSFEQWKSGNVLEHGVPRTEHYSEAQLDLVEMGWNYGYDAGRAVEQALDKKAENERELGIQMQPEWLTDEEVEEVWKRVEASDFRDVVQPFGQAIEAALRSKNT